MILQQLLSLVWSLGALGLAIAGLVYMFSPNHAKALLKKVGTGVALATVALMLLAALITELRAANPVVIAIVVGVSLIAFLLKAADKGGTSQPKILISILVSPISAVIAVVRFLYRSATALIRHWTGRDDKDIARINRQTELFTAQSEREKARQELESQKQSREPEAQTNGTQNQQPAGTETLSDHERARKKEELEATLQRVKDDEQQRLSQDDLPEHERREWENSYADKKRDLRQKIREYL